MTVAKSLAIIFRALLQSVHRLVQSPKTRRSSVRASGIKLSGRSNKDSHSLQCPGQSVLVWLSAEGLGPIGFGVWGLGFEVQGF